MAWTSKVYVWCKLIFVLQLLLPIWCQQSDPEIGTPCDVPASLVFAVVGDCTSYKFCLPVYAAGSFWRTKRCPVGTYFDARLKDCVPGDCSMADPVEGTPCNSDPNDVYPAEDDCSSYLYCRPVFAAGSFWSIKRCPEGYSFNEEIGDCEEGEC